MFCRGFGGYGFGYGPAGSAGIGWMFLAQGFRLIIFIALIILAYRLFKNYTVKSNNTLKVLDERFAKGEITEEEYLKMKSILSQKN